MADALGLEARVFPLDDIGAVTRGIAGARAVLHCAGPFTRTALPMARACLDGGVHYMDVTGEPLVFDALSRLDAEACERGVMLLPGVGFDVVPSDCLAAHLARHLPSATRLTLAFWSTGRPSRGTAATMAENAGEGGLVRRGGTLRRVPAAWHELDIDLGVAIRRCVTIPWGDVVTAFHSTGIGNIEVLMAAPSKARRALRLSRWLAPILRTRPIRAISQWMARRADPGPDAEERAAAATHLWGRVEDEDGTAMIARLHGPDGYTTTARCALEIASRVLAGDPSPGFQTPSTAFGPDLILDIEGFSREDAAPEGKARTT